MLDVSVGASRGSGDSGSKVRPAPGSLGCRTLLVVVLRGYGVSADASVLVLYAVRFGNTWQVSTKNKGPVRFLTLDQQFRAS